MRSPLAAREGLPLCRCSVRDEALLELASCLREADALLDHLGDQRLNCCFTGDTPSVRRFPAGVAAGRWCLEPDRSGQSLRFAKRALCDRHHRSPRVTSPAPPASTAAGGHPSIAGARLRLFRACGRPPPAEVKAPGAACPIAGSRGSHARTACRSWAARALAGRGPSARARRVRRQRLVDPHQAAVLSPNSNLVSARMIRGSPRGPRRAGTAQAGSRTSAARSAPSTSSTWAKDMLSSCPVSALVVGVKIGSGSRSESRSPGGSVIPQTCPLRW